MPDPGAAPGAILHAKASDLIARPACQIFARLISDGMDRAGVPGGADRTNSQDDRRRVAALMDIDRSHIKHSTVGQAPVTTGDNTVLLILTRLSVLTYCCSVRRRQTPGCSVPAGNNWIC